MGERKRLAPETFRLPVEKIRDRRGRSACVCLEGEHGAKVGRELLPNPRLEPVA